MNVITPVTPTKKSALAPFHWDDALMLDGQLSEDERARSATWRTTTARRSCSRVC